MRIARAELLDHAKDIAQEYRGNLTLRQLYYQLVARGYSPNTQRDYKRVGDIVADARLAGTFSFDWLIDRSRTVYAGSYTDLADDVDHALDQAAEGVGYMPHWYLKADRWWGQRKHVSVWVEKEALSGVFERPCNRLGVSWFACKGYPSLSSLYDWVRGVHAVAEEAESPEWDGLDEVVILYFGDHDPDGWQIPRSAVERLGQIQTATGLYLPPIRLERVALNMDQIQAYNPPPFPAKMTSSRYAGYVDEHGTDEAWELDALKPNQLQDLIQDGVRSHFDLARHKAVQETIRRRRDEMRDRMKDAGWLATALDNV